MLSTCAWRASSSRHLVRKASISGSVTSTSAAAATAATGARRAIFASMVSKASRAFGSAAHADPTEGAPSGAACTMHAASTYELNRFHNGNGHYNHHPTGVDVVAPPHAHHHHSDLHHTVDTVTLLQEEITTLRCEVTQRDGIIADLRARVAALERDVEAATAAAKKHARSLSPTSAAREAAKKSKAAAAAAATPTYPAGAVVVETNTELAAAIERRTPVIALPPRAVVRVPYGIGVKDVAIALHGPENCAPEDRPTIEAHVSVCGNKGALTVRNLHIRAPSTAEPCVRVNTGAKADLAHVTLTGGRDGVYTAGKAEVALAHSAVNACVRGVFEGQRSTVTVASNVFTDNLFACILLAKPKAPGAPREARVADDVVATGNTFVGGRCDVALLHNPMEDSYSDTWRAGKRCTLSPEESSTGLVDQSW